MSLQSWFERLCFLKFYLCLQVYSENQAQRLQIHIKVSDKRQPIR